MTQELFMMVVGVAGALAAFVLNSMWAEVKAAKTEISKLAQTLAKDYATQQYIDARLVTREQFDDKISAFFRSLDEIRSLMADRFTPVFRKLDGIEIKIDRLNEK